MHSRFPSDLLADQASVSGNTQVAAKEDELDPETSSAPDESESSSKKRLVVNELGNFCKQMSRGLESALEGEDGAEVERLAQEVRVRQRLRESLAFRLAPCINTTFIT